MEDNFYILHSEQYGNNLIYFPPDPCLTARNGIKIKATNMDNFNNMIKVFRKMPIQAVIMPALANLAPFSLFFTASFLPLLPSTIANTAVISDSGKPQGAKTRDIKGMTVNTVIPRIRLTNDFKFVALSYGASVIKIHQL
jgi:hypothetical protein